VSTPDQPTEQPNEGPERSAFDPGPDAEHTVTPDARTLRGLAHPVRVRIIGMLRQDGPSTATKLGERLGLSSAATSYHLRQLATYGFIAEADELGQGRERWWRALHRMTTFDMRASDDPEVAAEGEAFLRGVAELYIHNMRTYLDERPILTPEWQGASTLSDLVLRLTPQEAEELMDSIWQLVRTSRRADDPDAVVPAGARKVQVQLQVFPRPESQQDAQPDEQPDEQRGEQR
jgi:DNA-binding transcriptional ArsR family regulator